MPGTKRNTDPAVDSSQSYPILYKAFAPRVLIKTTK